MRQTTLFALLTAMAATAGIGAAQAQVPSSGPSSLRCSDISALEPAHAAALIYYIAGYEDAIRDAQTQVAGGTSDGRSPVLTEDQNEEQGAVDGSGQPATGGGAGAIGTLTLSAQSIVSACGQSPDSRIADIIVSQGGSGVSPVGSPNANPGAVEGPNVQVGVEPAPAEESGAAAPEPEQGATEQAPQ